MPETTRAPWTAEQVARLREYQTSGAFHPYTCGKRGEHTDPDASVLTPTVDGWVCSECDYRQDWAHGFHLGEASDD